LIDILYRKKTGEVSSVVADRFVLSEENTPQR